MHRIEYSQLIPTTLEEAWNFFSNPYNLKKITPQDMGFEVLTHMDTPTIHNGMMIEYRIRPLFNIATKWTACIEDVEPLRKFADNQVRGPYKIWHHTHTFEQVGGGVLMRDIVIYKIPFGLVGRFINKWIVNKRVKHIFDYRRVQISNLFKKDNHASAI